MIKWIVSYLKLLLLLLRLHFPKQEITAVSMWACVSLQLNRLTDLLDVYYAQYVTMNHRSAQRSGSHSLGTALVYTSIEAIPSHLAFSRRVLCYV
jgi:hypothetical protein